MQLKEGKSNEYKTYCKVNEKDEYSKNIVRYGEKWAVLMEAEIDHGKKLEDVAQATSLDAAKFITELTGFQYACAVSALSVFWIHGRQLFDWQNVQNKEIERVE